MLEKTNLGSLSTHLNELQYGQHLCCIYDNDEDYKIILKEFISNGLLNKDRVIYIINDREAEDVFFYDKINIDLGGAFYDHQLEIIKHDQAYTKDGFFDPDSMISMLKSEMENSFELGFQGLRVTGEMSWALRSLSGSKRLIEYEAKLNNFLPNKNCLAICQYDRRKFDSGILLDVLRTHPLAIIGQEVFQNIYYIPPKTLIGGDSKKTELTCWIESLKERKLAKEQIDNNQKNLDIQINETKKLKESNEMIAKSFDNDQVAIAITRKADSAFIEVNPGFCNIIECDRKEIIGKKALDLEIFSDDHRKWILDLICKNKIANNIELDIKTRSYQDKKLLISIRPIDINSEKCFMISINDITGIKKIEKELKFKNAIVEQSSDSIVCTDLAFCINYMNNAAEELFGWRFDELKGKTPDIFNAEENSDEIQKKIYQTISSGKRYDGIALNKRKDGTLFYCQHRVSPIFDSSGNIYGYMASQRDISALVIKEKELSESEKKYRDLVDLSPEAIFIHQDNEIVFVNPALVDLLGAQKADDLIGKSVFDFVDADYKNVVSDRIEKLYESNSAVPFLEQKILGIDGRVIIVESGAVPCVFNGKPAIQVAARDITQHKQIEDTLRRNEATLHEAQAIARIGSFVWDLRSDALEWSKHMFEIAGLDPDGFYGNLHEAILNIIHPEDVESVQKEVSDMVQQKKTWPMEFRIVRPDGEVRWIRSGSRFNFDDNGSPIWCIGVHHDITENKQAEKALLESEKNYRDIFENSHDAIFVHDADTGQIVDVNRAACNLFGYSADELKDMNVGDFSLNEHPYTQDDALNWIHKAKTEGPQKFQWHAKNKDGDSIWFENSLNFATIGNKERVLVFGHNIDDRIKAERESERLLSAIEQAGEVIVITDPDGAIQYVNPAFENVTGYEPVEVKGRNPRILKSGKQDEPFYRQLWETIMAGETWQGRLVNRRKDGSLYTEEATISPVFDEQGKITNFVAVKRDITSEIELENRLTQSQKMEAIGTLAGGIAHDFNNILSAMMGFSEMVDADLPEGSRNKEDIGEVIHACKRARDLVKQILTFSRQSDSEMRPLRIDLIVNEALKMIRSSTPTSIEIQQDIKSNIPAVIADPTQVHQIMMNLCTNAIQAIEDEHGTISVSLDSVRRGKLSDGKGDETQPSEYVRLVVSDTGKGMSHELLERIFEPYFTTKKAGEGTGLGLSVVYGIVKKSYGTIKVESEVGKGTTFSVLLPAAEKSESKQATNKQSRLPWGKERVLFIDDEPSIANLGRKCLERFGYDVTIRQSSLEALELFRNDPKRFDLLVTDMTMPHMTGDELAKEILSIRPDIPIVLCTGYSKRISDIKAKEIGIRAFVMKPLTQHELASAVRRVLDEN